MIASRQHRALLLILALLATNAPATQTALPLHSFARSMLAVRSSTGSHFFRVYLAVSATEKAQGLMYVDALPPATGMLFRYSPPQDVSMWMKNTRIPLDMLFIRADGSITRIAAERTPGSLETVRSGEPVSAVLELAGGTAERLGIAVGDHVVHPWFDRE